MDTEGRCYILLLLLGYKEQFDVASDVLIVPAVLTGGKKGTGGNVEKSESFVGCN